MKRRGKSAAAVAYSAVLGALSLVLVYVAAVVPTGNWGLVALSGVFTAAVVISVSLRAAFLCWAGVSILAFLLLPGKFCALMYAALFGLYPILKALIERLRTLWLEYILKLAFFNAAFTALYVFMRQMVLNSLPSALHRVWLLYLAANVVFLIYDFGVTKLIAFYIARIDRAIR